MLTTSQDMLVLDVAYLSLMPVCFLIANIVCYPCYNQVLSNREA